MKLSEKTNLPQLLKEIRKKKKLTQAKLAEKIYCSRHEIISIEKGEYAPNFKLICRWAKACGKQLMLRSITKAEIEIEKS
ncbi:MAG: helix-turn-helix transcriptional regulator [Synergistaceae bacterium]|nr:helix-turn-helix transcriptional regulator [Synergistaceae bacterium]